MKRILIVDDEQSITFGLSRCLQSEKVWVVCCKDTDAARSILSSGSVDAIITDVRLSRKDPLDTLNFIQFVRTKYRQIPLIVMSGTDELKEALMEKGADYFLEKPVNLDSLVHLLVGMGLEVSGNGSRISAVS